eukprot:1566919-Lingulodinium_polyedra.AAC.1
MVRARGMRCHAFARGRTALDLNASRLLYTKTQRRGRTRVASARKLATAQNPRAARTRVLARAVCATARAHAGALRIRPQRCTT